MVMPNLTGVDLRSLGFYEDPKHPGEWVKVLKHPAKDSPAHPLTTIQLVVCLGDYSASVEEFVENSRNTGHFVCLPARYDSVGQVRRLVAALNGDVA